MGRMLAKQIAAIPPNTLRFTNFYQGVRILPVPTLYSIVLERIFFFERSLEAGFAHKSGYYQATLSALLILGGILMVVLDNVLLCNFKANVKT